MSVKIGPGYSIVIRKDSMVREGIVPEMLVGVIADLVCQDRSLLVLGPLYETMTATQRLEDMGLEYFEDFFEIPDSGGPVAAWCEIELRMRNSEE